MSSSVLAISRSYYANANKKEERSGGDWKEKAEDFKKLMRMISFGEPIPSHHDNPLQLFIQQIEAESEKNIFTSDATDTLRQSKSKQREENNELMKHFINNKKPKNDNQRKNKSKRKSNIMKTEQRNYEHANDEMALLNFLVKLEEPQFRAQTAQNQFSQQMKARRREALNNAENRYKEIKMKAQRPTRRSSITERSSHKRPIRFVISGNDFKPELLQERKPKFESLLKVPTKQKQATFENPKKKKNNVNDNGKGTGSGNDSWYSRLDLKGAKNKITLSVAFAVIVTALFCVVVQLFKLFASPKNSSGYSDHQVNANRRSTYGYDRIALDIDEDETSATQTDSTEQQHQ